MSGKTVFDHLSEQIDNIARGRRYIIAEIGKVKMTVDELKDTVGASSGSDLGAVINDLKTYMNDAVSTLNDLKNSIAQLVSSMSGMKSSVENTYNIVKNMKLGGSVPAPTPGIGTTSPMTSTPPLPGSTPMGGIGTSPGLGTTSSMPSPGMPSAGMGAGGIFNAVIQAAQSGKPAKELGAMIDQIRTDLSMKNPLNPILFELSIEAGRLKSLGDKTLDASGIQSFKDKCAQWEAKSK